VVPFDVVDEELVEGDVIGRGTVGLESSLPQRYLICVSRQKKYYNSDFNS